MAPKRSIPPTGNLMVNVFDGSRQPIADTTRLLIRIIDGNQNRQSDGFKKGPNIAFRGLPFFDNFGDNYTVIVSADGHIDAGFTPVKLLRNAWEHLDLMLLPKDGSFNFSEARWEALQSTHPSLVALLSHGADSEAAAKDRYGELMEERSPTLAALLNITTAIDTIHLPSGTPLDYLKELIWDQMAQDRFYCYADKRLIEQVERATAQGVFRPEFGSGLFHAGATRSYKQVQFGEANVQLTFHEGDTRKLDGIECVKVEPDIDYFRDIAAHALLEVIPNSVTGGRTDPRQVYVLRWIAGRHSGVPEFNPPYTIV